MHIFSINALIQWHCLRHISNNQVFIIRNTWTCSFMAFYHNEFTIKLYELSISLGKKFTTEGQMVGSCLTGNLEWSASSMDCSYFSTVIYIPKKGDDAPHKDMFSTCTTLSCSCTHWSSPLLTTPPHKQIIPSNSQLSVHGSTPNVTGQSPNLEGRKDFKPDRNTSYFYVIPLPPPPPPPKNKQ